MKEAASKPEVAPQIPSYIGLSGTAVTSSTRAWSVAMCLHLIKSSSVLPTRSRGNCPNSFSSEYPMHDGQFSQVAVHSPHSYYRSYCTGSVCMWQHWMSVPSESGNKLLVEAYWVLHAGSWNCTLSGFRPLRMEPVELRENAQGAHSARERGYWYFPSRPQSFGRRTI